jgi:hypothetical protein
MHIAYNALPGEVQKKLDGMKTNNKVEDREYVSAKHKKTSQIHPLVHTYPAKRRPISIRERR